MNIWKILCVLLMVFCTVAVAALVSKTKEAEIWAESFKKERNMRKKEVNDYQNINTVDTFQMIRGLWNTHGGKVLCVIKTEDGTDCVSAYWAIDKIQVARNGYTGESEVLLICTRRVR